MSQTGWELKEKENGWVELGEGSVLWQALVHFLATLQWRTLLVFSIGLQYFFNVFIILQMNLFILLALVACVADLQVAEMREWLVVGEGLDISGSGSSTGAHLPLAEAGTLELPLYQTLRRRLSRYRQ